MSKKLPRHIVVLRLFAGAGFLLGAAGIVVNNPSLFWWAVAFAYAAFIAVAIDLRYELKSPRDRWWLGAGWALDVFLCTAFTFGIVLYDAPLQISPISYEGNYKKGEPQYGIVWDDDMSDLRIDIYNPTARDYEHLDLTIGIGQLGIRDEQQVTKLSGVTFIPKIHEVHLNLTDVDGKVTEERNQKVQFYNETRILCDKLPKHATLSLIFATSDFTPEARKATGPPKNGIFIVEVMPPFRFWMRKRVPSIRIVGDYSALNRPYKIDETRTVRAE
jgi:hypothetical protein